MKSIDINIIVVQSLGLKVSTSKLKLLYPKYIYFPIKYIVIKSIGIASIANSITSICIKFIDIESVGIYNQSISIIIKRNHKYVAVLPCMLPHQYHSVTMWEPM